MTQTSTSDFESVDAVAAAFAAEQYITDRPLALTLKLAADLEKPILLEGEAGVGKTEVAKVLATILDTPLIRLQCYEGLDANTTLYEWNYARQMIEIRLAMALGGKAFCTLTGDVAAVTSAVDAGARIIGEKGLLVNKVVIPNACQELLDEMV